MATQQEIAKHLGLSLKGARNMLAKLEINNRTESLDSIRIQYIDSLDITGQERTGQLDITAERIKLKAAQTAKLKLETKQLRTSPKGNTKSKLFGSSVPMEKDKELASEFLNDGAGQIDKLAKILHETFTADYSHLDKYFTEF